MTFRFLTGMSLLNLYLSVLSLVLNFCFSGDLSISFKSSICPNQSITDFQGRIINSRKKKVSICDRVINQGIKGNIILEKGNFMPSPDSKPGKGKGVKREIAFFELTKSGQAVEGKGPGFYKKINTKLVFRTFSNLKGCFVANLNPGKYSMFVKEEGEWYANGFGTENEIYEVEVKEGVVTQVDFKINHGAFF